MQMDQINLNIFLAMLSKRSEYNKYSLQIDFMKKLCQTLLFVIENQSLLMLMKVESHEHFRCFTLNIMHLSWLVFLNHLPILKELLTIFARNHLVTNKQK